MKETNLKQIILILDEIIANKKNQSIIDLGGYIVGQLTLRDDTDELYERYPKLEIIGQNAWGLETLKSEDERAKLLFSEILEEVSELKRASHIYTSIKDIYTRLAEIVENKLNEPLNKLGSYIVGCTIVLDKIDELYKKYPVLEDIAELGAELETISDPAYQTKLFKEIESKIIILKNATTNGQ